MREQAIRAAAALFGVRVQSEPPNSQGWMSVGCPYAPFTHEKGFDRNPSMRVLVRDGGVSYWKCWSCNQGHDLVAMLYDLQRLGAELPYEQLMLLATGEGDELVFPSFEHATKEYVPPPVLPEAWLDTMPLLTSVASCVGANYMRARGYHEGDWEAHETRWDPHDQRVIWPIRDTQNLLRGVQGRAINEATKPKYLHYPYQDQARGSEFFLGENTLDFDKPIVVVEGSIDKMGVHRAYSNVCAIMGASTILRPEKLDRLATAFAVIPFLDGNKAGKIGMETVKRWCHKKRLCVPVYAPEGRDPGNLHEETIGELVGEALGKINKFV